MIYSTDFLDICRNLNYIEIVKYLVDLGWEQITVKRKDIKIFQKKDRRDFAQVTIPMDSTLNDFAEAMFNAAKVVSESENKSLEQTILEWLNPMSDIVRVRIDNADIYGGSINIEDGFLLFDNVKKLISATANDVISPSQYHSGRPFDAVQQFMSNCRLGQTEIGSYITNVICPFYNIDKDGVEQITLFEPEEVRRHSFTRKVTTKLLTSIARVKETIDSGEDLFSITESKTDCISINFLDSLQCLQLHKKDAVLDLGIKWAPTVKSELQSSSIRLTHEYCEPIRSVVQSYKSKKDVVENNLQEFVGLISKLNGDPSIEQRKQGEITFVTLDKQKGKSITLKAILSADDYNAIGIEAHRKGSYVRIKGELHEKILKNCIISFV